MNEHDSEKVAGLLLARGYQQVENRRSSGADSLQHLQHPRKSSAKGFFVDWANIADSKATAKKIAVLRLRGPARRRGYLHPRSVGQPGLRLGQLPQVAELLAQVEAGAQARHRAWTTTPAKLLRPK